MQKTLQIDFRKKKSLREFKNIRLDGTTLLNLNLNSSYIPSTLLSLLLLAKMFLINVLINSNTH